MDLKAVFDRVDREKLWRIMEEKGMDKGMIGRVKRMYENTEVIIKTKNGLTKELKHSKQEKASSRVVWMSPLLFNIYMADLDNRFKKRNIGGISVGEDRIWSHSWSHSFTYADNIVIVAKNRETIKDMMDTLGF